MKAIKRKIIGGKTRGYICDGCGRPFRWDRESQWYGSEKDIENGRWDKVWFACCAACAAKKPADFGAKPRIN
jgi:hypothetical protein